MSINELNQLNEQIKKFEQSYNVLDSRYRNKVDEIEKEKANFYLYEDLQDKKQKEQNAMLTFRIDELQQQKRSLYRECRQLRTELDYLKRKYEIILYKALSQTE